MRWIEVEDKDVWINLGLCPRIEINGPISVSENGEMFRVDIYDRGRKIYRIYSGPIRECRDFVKEIIN